MTWWLWMVVGCGLLILEMLTPGGFFFLFFGFGAIITGVIAMFGVIDTDWVQIGLFTIISVVCMLLFRRKIKGLLEKSDASGKDINGLVGLVGTAVGDLAVDANGNVEVRGANWGAKNIGTTALVSGARCKVEKVHGITLHVKAE